MLRKLLRPFKKISQKIQNLPGFQKLQHLTTGKHTEQLRCYDTSVYGIYEDPVSLAYDQDLELLAVAFARGRVAVYGEPGLSFPVDFTSRDIQLLEFLRNEGRLVVATVSSVVLLEFDATTGRWSKKSSVDLPFTKDEKITALAVGRGYLYVGSTSGTLRQIAVHKGCMTVGDDKLTSLSSKVILTKVPEDKREQVNLQSTIVSIEVHPNGGFLVVGYAGGTALIAEPQPLHVEPEIADKVVPTEEVAAQEEVGPVSNDKVEQTTEEKIDTTLDEQVRPVEQNQATSTSEESTKKKVRTGEKKKDHLRAMHAVATKPLRTLSGTFKGKVAEKPAQPLLAVPPAPRVTHLLPYSQALCCVTWRCVSLDQRTDEVIAAYDDGAHITWKVKLPEQDAGAVENAAEDIIICVSQDVANIPYGPLPCSPITKIITRPSVTAGIIMAIGGGLPRAQHSGKHTVSVLGGRDEHVCFQFGSAVRDFLVVPRHTAATRKSEMVKQQFGESEKRLTDTIPKTPTEAAYLLILTDRELVAVDLTQPCWPVIQSPYLSCLDCSNVTSVAHIAVSSPLIERFKNCGADVEPGARWPVRGGHVISADKYVGTGEVGLGENKSNLLILGHLDGYVSFWSLDRGDCFRRLCRLHTPSLLDVDALTCSDEQKIEEEAWPPFRRVGCFYRSPNCATDCASIEDSRFAVTTLAVQVTDARELNIMVGGAAGQVSQWTTAPVTTAFKAGISRINVDLLSCTDHYIREGPVSFNPAEGVFKHCPSACSLFSPCGLVQMHPPSAVTAIAWEEKWEALAIGTDFGFALIDLKTQNVAYQQFTHEAIASVIDDNVRVAKLESGSRAGIQAGDHQLQATKRQPFRKLRKSRSGTATVLTKTEAAGGIGSVVSAVVDAVIESAEAKVSTEGDRAVMNPASSSPMDVAEEVAVFAPELQFLTLKCHRQPNSVRCFLFSDTFIVSPPAKDDCPAVVSSRVATLWVGTQAGTVLAYRLTWLAAEALSVTIAKELQLRHAAPILGMRVIDAKTYTPLSVSEKTRSVNEFEELAPTTEEKVAETDEATGKIDAKVDEVVEENKPSTTDEASPPVQETPVTTTAPIETHELLVCTEEQVKMFALPSLRPKYKYRFLNKSASLEKSARKHKSHVTEGVVEEGMPKAVEVQEGDQQQATDEVITASGDDMCVEDTSSVANGPYLQRIAAFALQPIPQCSGEDEWHVVVALRNGCITALTLPNLRRSLKAYCCDQSDCCLHTMLVPCVSETANLVLWPLSTGQVVVNELTSSRPSRSAPALLPNPCLVGPDHGNQLPELAQLIKPVIEEVATGITDLRNWTEKAAELVDSTATVVIEIAELAASETEQTVVNASRKVSNLFQGINSVVQQVGDITDSIKEFLHDDCTVTVKTTENSLEKHTIIEGGQVMTTVHETECIDGEITKDDVVQLKSSEEPDQSVTTLSGSA